MINTELSFLGDFTAALTLIFISLENVGSDFWGYGNAWGFVHRLKFLSESGYPGFEDVEDVIWCLYFGIF
jgi:hypothetical protein